MMNEAQFLKLTEKEQLDYANKRFSEGISGKELSKEIFGKESKLSSHFNDLDYVFFRGRYMKVLDPSKVVEEPKSVKEVAIDSLGDLKKLEPIVEQLLALVNNKEEVKDKITLDDVLTVATAKQDEILSKQFRVNKEIFKRFDDFCDKEYPAVLRQDLLSLALKQFLDKYSKK